MWWSHGWSRESRRLTDSVLTSQSTLSNTYINSSPLLVFHPFLHNAHRKHSKDIVYCLIAKLIETMASLNLKASGQRSLIALEERKRNRPIDARVQHIKLHGFAGYLHTKLKAPLWMQIRPETTPLTVVMYTTMCLWCLTVGWFTCSLFGYTLCRQWRNVPPAGESANLDFIFNTTPLNRWAVNLAVSFGMLLYFTAQATIFIYYKLAINRDRQKKFAEDNNWIEKPPENEESPVSCCHSYPSISNSERQESGDSIENGIRSRSPPPYSPKRHPLSGSLSSGSLSSKLRTG